MYTYIITGKRDSGRMNLSGLDITLARISQIETKVNSVDKKFARLFDQYDGKINSFDNVLNEKIKGSKTTNIDDDINVNNSSADKKELSKLVEKYAQKNNLDKKLVDSVIKTESAYNHKAVSPVGAMGLMQLMPSTAQSLGVNNPFDPEENISGGTKYLKNLINKYDSVELGLAAYNAGPATVNKYGGIPPYEETRNYVKKVLELQKSL